MKCPRCGNEMVLDTHRKYPLNMCYECGYMEGRPVGDTTSKTNYEHMKTLNFNEMVVFLSKGLGLEESVVSNFAPAQFLYFPYHASESSKSMSVGSTGSSRSTDDM